MNRALATIRDRFAEIVLHDSRTTRGSAIGGEPLVCKENVEIRTSSSTFFNTGLYINFMVSVLFLYLYVKCASDGHALDERQIQV